MRKRWRDRRFRVCVLLFAGLFLLTLRFEYIDRYHPFPYILIFHALVLYAWLSGLYFRWDGRWKPGDGPAWGTFVLVCALPQVLMCGVSLVSRVLLGVSLVLGTGAILLERK